MSKKRPQDYTDDLNRIAETLRNTDAEHQIKDKNSFNEAWLDYFEGNTEGLGGDMELRDRCFKIYATEYEDRLLTTSFEGLPRRQVGVFRREIREFPQRPEKPKKEFNVPTKEKGRVVYARRETVKVRGKEQVRFRDRFGRFAKVKK